MVTEHGASVRQACRAARLARSAFYAPRRPRDDGPIITAIRGFVEINPTQGFDKLYPALRPEGFGKCHLYRVYRALGLNMKRRGKRRLPARVKTPLVIPGGPNEVWSADFMADALWSGRRFRTFNVYGRLQPRGAADRDRHEPAGAAHRTRARRARGAASTGRFTDIFGRLSTIEGDSRRKVFLFLSAC
jgi:hypothetical protein